MPAPADVQTTNGGTTPGRPEAADTVVLTFAGTVNPDLVISGWDGSPTTVTVTFTHSGNNYWLTIDDPGGAILWNLGAVGLDGHYTNDVSFTGSTMTASGDTVTVVLGSAGAGTIFTVSTPSTMLWWTPTGFATESGPADAEF